MKTRILVMTAAAALMIGALAFAGTESDKKSPETGLEQLQNKIAVLESRVKTLELRLAAPAPVLNLPQLPPQIQPQSGSDCLRLDELLHPLPQSPAGNAQHPKIWGEGQINGWKYYVIPCAEDSGVSPEAGRQNSVHPLPVYKLGSK